MHTHPTWYGALRACEGPYAVAARPKRILHPSSVARTRPIPHALTTATHDSSTTEPREWAPRVARRPHVLWRTLARPQSARPMSIAGYGHRTPARRAQWSNVPVGTHSARATRVVREGRITPAQTGSTKAAAARAVPTTNSSGHPAAGTRQGASKTVVRRPAVAARTPAPVPCIRVLVADAATAVHTIHADAVGTICAARRASRAVVRRHTHCAVLTSVPRITHAGSVDAGTVPAARYVTGTKLCGCI